MNNETFLLSLAEILQAPAGTITEDYPLDGGNWDSVAVMATIALIDEQYDITIPAKDLVSCVSVKDLFDLITIELHRPLAKRD